MSSEHIASLAEKFGASAALIERSARARAEAGGSSAEAVLSAWAGGSAPPVAAAAPDPSPADQPAEVTTATTDEQALAPEEDEPAAVAAEPDPAATPQEPDPGSTAATTEPAVSAGPSGFSPWLVAALFIIPLFGLMYLVINSNGVACGEGGSLEVAFDGSLINCDGTEFEGRGGGGAEAAAFLTLGQEVYSAGGQCASCHGNNGQGGTGPAMAGGAVLVTWPGCDDHVEWITLGSDGWSVARGSSYGAEDKPVQGGMPAFANDLTEEEIRAVTAFERIRFGGADVEETLIACGLIVPEDEATEATDEPQG